MPLSKHLLLAGFFAAIACAPSVRAQQMEKVKVATSFLGLWDTSQPTFCRDRGEFAKAGLDVEVFNTRGGSENLQAVIAGGNDIGYSPGTNAVLAAYLQGAKIKIISSEFIGQNNSFWYVLKDSPIKTIDDIKGKSVAFPRPGGSSEAVLLALKAKRHIDFNAVATGGMDATFTMVMTKQIDVGYSVPPTALAEIGKGDLRVIFTGDDAQSIKNISANITIASADFIKKRRAVAVKFMRVLDQCIDWAYAHQDQSLKTFAAMNKIDAHIAAKSLEFYKRSALAFGPVSDLDGAIKLAVESKTIANAPTQAQLKDLIDIVYMTPKK